MAASVVIKHSIVACKARGSAAGRAPVRAHAGLNHARAFAHAADADGFAAQLEFDRDLLGPRVAGHDGFNGMRGVFDALNPIRRTPR